MIKAANSIGGLKIERLSDSVVVGAASQQRQSDAEPTRTAASGTHLIRIDYPLRWAPLAKGKELRKRRAGIGGL